MTTVIIAEKKEAAIAIANALLVNYQQWDGYIEGQNGSQIITWAQGHLLRIKDPGEMNEAWEDWNWETLPIFPSTFALKPISQQQSQLNVIARLTKGCSLIVNAMDSGIEGDLIYTFIADYLKLHHKPTKRLWTASLQPTAIKKAYAEMKDISAYQYLRNAGLARSQCDYLVGINCSRSLTLAGEGKTLSAGRVMLCVLSLIYDRQVARDTFEPETYYSLKGMFQQGDFYYEASYKGDRLTEPETVRTIIQSVEQQEGQVKFEDKTKLQEPPLLPNLTDVAVLANQRYGMKVQHVTRLLESLYLKKCITYPRTANRTVTPDEYPLMRAAYWVLIAVYPNLQKGGDINRLSLNNKRVFDATLVGDHHAILPEVTVPDNLTDEEQLVYQIIVERFFLQFQAPVKSLQRKVTTTVANYQFQTTFKKIEDYGWKGLELNFDHDYQDDEIDEESTEELVKDLPTIYTNQAIKNVGLEPKERKTSAPAQYTEGTLMKQMENISSLITDKKYKEILKGCGIGTSATRAETIKKLLDIGYIVSHKKKLEVTELGMTVMELLRKSESSLLTSPELTARWELELEEIKKGKDMQPFQEAVKNFVIKFVEDMQEVALSDETRNTFDSACPNCGKPIKSNKNVYYCTNNKGECSFFLWKKQYSKTISQKMLDDLLTKGETSLLTFTAKNGKHKYKARFKLPPLPIENGKLKLDYL